MLKRYPNANAYLPFNLLNHTQVWLLTDSFTQKMLFIKQLTHGFNQRQFEQFSQEYRVYQKIGNLVENEQYFASLIDFYQENGNYFLVLTFHSGKTLKQIIAENRLNFSQKIAVLIELCRAINAFHALGFIHCDIKPSNVLIMHNQLNQLKLLDFGLAQDIEHTRSLPMLTAGTPAYMSPEQFTGGRVTRQSDYYSLGIVLYDILIEQKPFSATSLEDWAMAHCQIPIPKIMQFKPNVNFQLQRIVDQLLAKFAINRPQDLTEIITLLENLPKA